MNWMRLAAGVLPGKRSLKPFGETSSPRPPRSWSRSRLISPPNSTNFLNPCCFPIRATGATHGPVDRKSVVSGKRVSVRVDRGGGRIIKKKKKKKETERI